MDLNQLEAFSARVLPFLEQDEAANNLLLGFLQGSLRFAPGHRPFFREFHQDGALALVAVTTGLNLILSQGKAEALPQLVDALQAENVKSPAVVGPAELVDVFTPLWLARGAARIESTKRQGLLTLTEIIPPNRTNGQLRLIEESDIDPVAEWLHAFEGETFPAEQRTVDEARNSARDRVPLRRTFLWEIDQTPVAMAALARPTRTGITVNAVYTPPALRGRGYGTAVAAAVTAEGLRRGKKFCVLFTDLDNPTSNGIYTRMGYQRVGTFVKNQLSYL